MGERNAPAERSQRDQWTALNPLGFPNEIPRIPLAPRPHDLNNKVVYLIYSLQIGTGFEALFEKTAAYLKQRFPNVKIVFATKPNVFHEDAPDFWEDIAQKADAYLYSAAPSSSPTAYAIEWPAKKLEKRGIPGASVVYDYLAGDARAAAKKAGASMRYVSVPYPYGHLSDEELAPVLQQIESALTAPLTQEEQRSGVDQPEPPPRIGVTGTFAEIQEHFHENGWTDGLPIVPPTEERVAEMLKGTSHPPDQVVTRSMPPEGRSVTVEKVAINAVMAGARPEYMPVLLAAVELLGQTPSFFATVKSTNSFSFMQVINGPIRHELGMNAGVCALGPGNRANAVIGRALNLLLINLGGARAGINVMGVQGNTSSYAFAFAENEEHSPWESFAAERGYQAHESTITIFTGGWNHVGNYIYAKFDKLLEAAAQFESISGLTVLLSPRRAHMLAEEGFTKQSLIEHIWKNAAIPMKKFKENSYFHNFVLPDIQGKAVLRPKEYLYLPDDAIVPVFPRKEVHVLVVGDPSGTPMMQGWHMANPVTNSIDKWR